MNRNVIKSVQKWLLTATLGIWYDALVEGAPIFNWSLIMVWCTYGDKDLNLSSVSHKDIALLNDHYSQLYRKEQIFTFTMYHRYNIEKYAFVAQC